MHLIDFLSDDGSYMAISKCDTYKIVSVGVVYGYVCGDSELSRDKGWHGVRY